MGALPFGAWAALSRYAPEIARILGFTGVPSSVGPGLGTYLIDPFISAKENRMGTISTPVGEIGPGTHGGSKLIVVAHNGTIVSDMRPEKYKQ
jgi:hypothetical protein